MKLMKPINEKEMRELLTRIEDDAQQAVIRLAWQAGLTAEEIGRLMWSDVDFTNDTIRVGIRVIPMAQDLSDFFSQMDRRGPFVIYSRKDPHSPSSRNNITLKSREAFRRMGLNDMTLKTLKYDFVVRTIDKLPMEEVSRITGITRRSLREMYKAYTGAVPHDYPRARPALFFDKSAILAAAEREKDSIDSTALLLSMMGGLTAEDMAELKWEDVDLSSFKMRVGSATRSIPPDLAEHLRELKAQSPSSARYILRGVISGNRLDPVFIVKHVRQFLVRNNLDAVNLSVLRGAYDSLDESKMELAVINKMKRGVSSVERISKELNIGCAKTAKLLNGLCKNGKIHYVEESKQYVLNGRKNNWEKILAALPDCTDDNGDIRVSCLADKTKFTNSLLRYYLNKAIEEHLIVKKGRAKYRVVI